VFDFYKVYPCVALCKNNIFTTSIELLVATC